MCGNNNCCRSVPSQSVCAAVFWDWQAAVASLVVRPWFSISQQNQFSHKCQTLFILLFVGHHVGHLIQGRFIYTDFQFILSSVCRPFHCSRQRSSQAVLEEVLRPSLSVKILQVELNMIREMCKQLCKNR